MGRVELKLNNDSSDLKCRFCVPPERHEGCHATCEHYQKWQVGHIERKFQAYRERCNQGVAADKYYCESVAKAINKRNRTCG